MNQTVRLSKFVSYVLRHRPQEAALSIDREGWVDVESLVEAARRRGFPIDRAALEALVAASDKKRFTLSEDRTRIRAAQGHSAAEVEIAHVRHSPPDILYHGTAKSNVASILQHGLRPGRRHYVHLSLDVETALSVGRRHGDPIVIFVDAKGMNETGAELYRADNGVWLTRSVAPRFLRLEKDAG